MYNNAARYDRVWQRLGNEIIMGGPGKCYPTRLCSFSKYFDNLEPH